MSHPLVFKEHLQDSENTRSLKHSENVFVWVSEHMFIHLQIEERSTNVVITCVEIGW